jgi:maleylacetoacetate isomerase
VNGGWRQEKMRQMDKITLYDYWRSSASYRVRIALNLKGLDYSSMAVDLLNNQHKSPEHLRKNPQAIVPAIDIGDKTLTQSLAIIEYLDEIYPRVPLQANDAEGRARIRKLSYAIAMEIHPVCNLSVVNHVAELTGGGDQVKIAWMQKFIGKGLTAFEKYLDDGATGSFCHGETVSMADCCLIPQLYNAKRWGADYSGLEKICAIEETCGRVNAFVDAHPDQCNPNGL